MLSFHRVLEWVRSWSLSWFAKPLPPPPAPTKEELTSLTKELLRAVLFQTSENNYRSLLASRLRDHYSLNAKPETEKVDVYEEFRLFPSRNRIDILILGKRSKKIVCVLELKRLQNPTIFHAGQLASYVRQLSGKYEFAEGARLFLVFFPYPGTSANVKLVGSEIPLGVVVRRLEEFNDENCCVIEIQR